MIKYFASQKGTQMDVAVHTHSLRTQETEAGDSSQAWHQPGLHRKI